MFRETEGSLDVDGLRAQVQLLQKEKALLQEALVEGAAEGGGDTGGSGVVPPRQEAPTTAGSSSSGSGMRRLMVPTPTIETPRMVDSKTDIESHRPRSPLTPLFDGPTSGVRGSSWCCAATASRPLSKCSVKLPRPGAASPKDASPAVELLDGAGPLEHEEIATGVLARTRRTADTLLVGTKLHFSVKALEKEMDKKKDADEQEVRELWDELHKKNADMVFRHIMKYRGFFIKAGQKASTMAGVLPDPWVQALTPLQDCIPITAFPSVQKTVMEDLGRALEEIYCEFEQTPIASASIGQAHVARLRQDGLKVCVKIEHPGIAELASVDLDNLEVLIKWLGTSHPNAPDFSEVVKEMRRSSLEEVDFRLEAKNAQEALRALQQAGSRMGCPEPFMQYCGPHVLTMRFIEGWKITETERLPPNTDREGMAADIVDAFATLVFKEGLIHGDPHPGNIFVEQGPSSVRPILLDWGIVKKVTPEERNTLAKWVVASLSRDRFLYLATLSEMGLSLTQGEVDHSSLDMFMFTGMLQLRDTMPTNAKRQFHEQFSKQAEIEKGKKDKKLEKSGKKLQKLIEKIPGWIHFFFRGLNMLQDVCGMLDVTVPVAKLMLRHALPVLGCTCSPGVPLLPKAMERSPLERLILAKLEELGASVLGGQVAVLSGDPGLPGEWRCNVAFGRMGPAGAPLSEESLLPALDLGLCALQCCLLAALSRPTVTGKEITLDTPVERLWPEFSRGGKSGISIRELLQHQGGLARPFKGKTNFKTFINEQQMEEMIAAAPRAAAGPGAGGPCAVRPVLGAAVASLLRRALGKKNAGEALRAALQPLGLHEHILYKGAEERMARVGHRLLEEVTMATIWEILEERMERETGEEKKLPPWLDWREFSAEQPWCVDPLLVNCKELREGRGCCPGRGIRATAQGLCRLLSSGAVPAALLDRSRSQPRRVEVESLEEWEDYGRCLDVSAGGWQLLRFRRAVSGEEVLAHGQVDGATGSLALRLPGVSIAIMLTCSDRDTRHVGHELLSVVAAQLGLEPIWQLDVPKVPERVQRGQSPLGHRGAAGNDSKEGRIESAISRLEGQVARLTEALANQGGPGLALAAPTSHPLEGTWNSAETLGLEELLDALDVPAMARVLAKKMQRTLRFEVRGDSVSIGSTTSVAGRTVEDTTTAFEVGKPFNATMFTKPCTGTARWEEQATDGDPEGRTLVVQKVIEVGGHSVTIEERAEVTPEGRLAWQTIVKGPGDVIVELQNEADREQISRNLDKKSRRLTKEVALSSGKQVLRGGVLATVKGNEVTDKAALAALELPGSISLHYGNFQSTMLFDLEGGPKARSKAAAAGAAPGRTRSARALVPKPRSQGRAVRAVQTGSGCCSGLCMARQALAHLLASRLRAAARWLEGGSTTAAASQSSSQHLIGRAGSSVSMEGFQSGPLRSQSSQGSAPQALERSFQEAMTLTRQISNSTFGDTENGNEHA